MNNCDLIFAVGGAILGGLTVFGIIKEREMKKIDEFNRNLKNVSNIYESIANSVTQNRNTKPFNVSFG